jgi:hypothetical protein
MMPPVRIGLGRLVFPEILEAQHAANRFPAVDLTDKGAMIIRLEQICETTQIESGNLLPSTLLNQAFDEHPASNGSFMSHKPRCGS